MKLGNIFVALLLTSGVASVSSCARSSESESAAAAKKEREEGQKPGEGALPPEMEVWMKVAAPGEAHKALEAMVGDWETHSKFIMSPGAPPMETKGTCSRKMILGGRFLQEEVAGEFMGISFQGLGLMGYDNMKQKYVGAWVDTMMTGVMSSIGTSEEGGKKFTMSGEYDDPMTKTKKRTRMVLMIESKDKNLLDFYETGPDGKEFKSGEMVFTRKK